MIPDVDATGSAGLRHLEWSPSDGAPSVDTVASRLRREGVEPHAWSNGPGDRYATHDHGFTKLLMCAVGSITFIVGSGGSAVELRPGDGFVLPAGTPHAAVVGPAGCTCLEGHRT
jgi:quercetin dioxygenase-like cupin family protein